MKKKRAGRPVLRAKLHIQLDMNADGNIMATGSMKGGIMERLALISVMQSILNDRLIETTTN